jgi:hypothetical protein
LITLRAERGLKNLLNDLGVTGGALLGFRRDANEGEDGGITWDELSLSASGGEEGIEESKILSISGV